MDIAPSPNGPRQAAPAVLLFGPFALDRVGQLLLKSGRPVRIGSRAFGLLVDLVESAGQLRTREQLEARVWPRSVVEETSLRVHISALRRVLGDGRDGARYIANVPGCGYSFIGTVTGVSPSAVTDMCMATGAVQALPAPSGECQQLVGRAAELASLRSQCTHARLLSIAGPGGIGKTALALAVAQSLEGQFAHGVVYADLAAVSATCGVVETVAAAVEIALPGAGRLAALCAALGARRALLVLDNCERALEDAAALALALLQGAPGIHMLVTTREPLDVQGERVHWLDGLDTPADEVTDRLADPRQALMYSAVQLFVARATANNDRFVLDAHNVGDVCRLCRHLDGIPLAIELAAARVEAMGVGGLVAGLGDLLALLTRARRTALPRHRTMDATLAWSFDLLAGAERSVLCRSAVFQAEFSIAAARAVCTCKEIDAAAVAGHIESLAAKSLLLARIEGNTVLYRQLRLMRSYAWGKLDDPARAALAHRHAQHVAALLARSTAAVALQDALPWVGAHGRAVDDCRAALDWAFGEEGDRALGIRMTPDLIQTLRFLGLPDDFRRRLMRALDERDAPRLAPEVAISVYAALAVLGAYSHTEFDLLREVLARLHGLLGAVDSAVLRSAALLSIGSAAYGMGETGLLLEVVRALRALAGQEDNPAYAVMADRLESSARHFRGEHDAAEALCQRVLQSAVAASAFGVSCPTPSPVGGRWNLARIAWIRGQPELAAQLAHEALVHAEHQHGLAQCQTLVIVALPIALWRGDGLHAAQLLARLETLAGSLHSPYWQGWARAYAAALPAAPDCAQRTQPWTQALAPIGQDILATLNAGLLCPETLARADAGAIGWCAAEVWRVQGERLLRQGGAAREQASALLLRALALARSQRALGWELRIAGSLLTCWHDTPRAGEGLSLLADALGRFSEGRDTADCRAARAQLACGTGAGAPRCAA